MVTGIFILFIGTFYDPYSSFLNYQFLHYLVAIRTTDVDIDQVITLYLIVSVVYL